EIGLESLKHNADVVFELYENVSDNAGVNSFKLHKNHFYELKNSLADNFKIIGYYIEFRLVGFFTLIDNGRKLETYFLGYNPKLQHKHQMYLNMLFDMVDYGISNGYEQIIFARTAMEIKSSVGAKPFDMSIYLKHTNSFFLNRILRNIIKFMNPVRDWEERRPFS
ncbi:MAG: GNAT family N-acetyltransferase, partial [Bacteroidota bacterium]